MRKRILLFLTVAALLFTLLPPFYAHGAEPLDPDAEVSLTLTYQKDGTAFPNLSVQVYRIAQAFPDGTFELIAPFSTYPVNIHGITAQEQWTNVANTLHAYIIADHLAPDATAQTDAGGKAVFTGLQTGLYLVEELIAENSNGTYVFNRFLIYLPVPGADGSYLYHADANPKCVSYVPKAEYKVTKLWQDAGHQAVRPKEVLIDIYKDGVLQETQSLNPENNWTYTWYVSAEDHGQWTVVERSSSERYTVTIQQSGNCFTIINTTESDPPDRPDTGDTSHFTLYVLLMCISGVALILIGIYGRRRKGA